MVRSRLVLLAASALLLPAALRAQCPDGTPPPCDVARRLAARAQVPALAQRGRRFLLLPFRNTTGAREVAWLVEGSTTLLADALGQWQELFVVPDARLYPSLRRHGLTPGAVMDDARVRLVAEETGGWTAVSGEVLATGNRVRVTARAVDVPTGRVVVRASQEVGAGEDVRAAYQRIAGQLLVAAGLDPSALDLPAATTASLDAYRSYLRGIAATYRSAPTEARAAFLEAVRLDSNFAQAYARLANASMTSIQTILDPSSDAYRYAERAGSLAGRLPARERRFVRGCSAMFAGQLQAAREAFEGLIAEDSNDVEALSALAGIEAADPVLIGSGANAHRRGSLNKAARYAKRVIELDPARHNEYGALVSMYAMAAGLWGGTVTGVAREAGTLSALLTTPPTAIYTLLLRDTFELTPFDKSSSLSRDSLAALRRVAIPAADAWSARWVQAGPTEAEAHSTRSHVAELAGRYDEALREVMRAESLGIQSHVEEPAARRMILLGELGRYAEARRLADSLTAAGFFESQFLGAQLQMEQLGWAFHVLVVTGALDTATVLIDRVAALLRPRAGAAADYGAALNLCGRTPRVAVSFELPDAFAEAEVDSVLAALPRWPRDGAMARCATMIVGAGIEQLPASRKAPVASRVMAAALMSGARGDTLQGYRVAMAALDFDSTLIGRLASAGWYLERANQSRIHTRFQPGTVTVSDSAAVFTWRVTDAAPFRWWRETSREFAREYNWRIEMRVGTKTYVLASFVQKPAAGAAHEGPLGELAAAMSRMAMLTDSASGERRTFAAPLLEAAPGELRFTVPRGELLDALRQGRPPQARYVIQPCVRDPALPANQCEYAPVTVTYR